ncbi:hypothetical protein [Nocardia sp. NPDC050406]|uniref:hypothetical protein n=1 Tax=Nocardia sp. NPDC050406 TaxID=3364318 RepID=UPI00379E27ED
MPAFDAQALIDAGHRRICAGCGFLVGTSTPQCPRCGHNAEGATARRAPRTGTRKRANRFEAATGDAVVTELGLGGMASVPDRTLWLVSHGVPKTQGSMVAVAPGQLRAADKQMYGWRDTIAADALRQVGIRWQPIDAPVHIDVCFTLPFPARFEDQSERIAAVEPDCAPRIPAMQTPDRDKLLRAVQDALSLLDPGNKGDGDSVAGRFKLVADDSRFVYGSEAKTYPRPGHTHAWALDRPGAVIRVTMIDSDVEPMPRPTLRTPGDLPGPVAALHEEVVRRNRLAGMES